MSKFLTPLDCRQLTGDTWQLLNPLEYQSDLLKAIVIVPAGFKTDYASTPRFIWFLMPKSGLWDAAAVIHDYLYTFKEWAGVKLTQKNCDDTFLEAMGALGVGWMTRHTMWSALRMFGFIAFSNHDTNGEPK